MSPTNASVVAYDTGHGPFCFGRLIERYDFLNRRSLNQVAQLSDLSVPELDSFQGTSFHAPLLTSSLTHYINREGHFPFSHLPVEIRYKILHPLLEPFYYYNSYTEVRDIDVTLLPAPPAPSTPSYYEGNYDNYLAVLIEQQRRGRFLFYGLPGLVAITIREINEANLPQQRQGTQVPQLSEEELVVELIQSSPLVFQAGRARYESEKALWIHRRASNPQYSQ